MGLAAAMLAATMGIPGAQESRISSTAARYSSRSSEFRHLELVFKLAPLGLKGIFGFLKPRDLV